MSPQDPLVSRRTIASMKRMSITLLLVGALAVGVLPVASAAPTMAPPTPSRVANGIIVAGPGGFISPGTYATPVVTAPKGTRATFYNVDIAPHDVMSIDKNKKGKPVFRSKLIGLGQSSPVAGTEKLAPGNYTFFCSRHHWMQGKLVVTP